MDILGEDNDENDLKGSEIHKNLDEKSQYIIQKGLSTENRKDLLKKYHLSKNCNLLRVPKLNPEIQVLLQDGAIKRDRF